MFEYVNTVENGSGRSIEIFSIDQPPATGGVYCVDSGENPIALIGVLMCGLSASFLLAIVTRLVNRETPLSDAPPKPKFGHCPQ
jgi:hypothetical protein